MRTKSKKKILKLARNIDGFRDDAMEIAITMLGPIVMVAVLGAIALIVWYGPIWAVASRIGPHNLVLLTKDRLDLENSFRATIVQFLGGAVVLIGSYLAYRNVKAVEKNIGISQDSQITDRFTRAIEQFGSERPEIRLGGLYALERVARDSERDHDPVMEVLTSYIRSQCARPIGTTPTNTRSTSDDVQPVLSVIGRRDWRHEIDGHCLDFSYVDLCGLKLDGGHFEDVRFDNANLEGCTMLGTGLDGASFINANLRHVSFAGAELIGTDFKDALLDAADLRGCDISQALNLTSDQLSAAVVDASTTMLDPTRLEIASLRRIADPSVE